MKKKIFQRFRTKSHRLSDRVFCILKKLLKRGTAFTLLELIVVVTILTILGVIAYFNMVSFLKHSRDTVRLENLKLIDYSMELFSMQTGLYPQPTNGIDITFSGATLWTQGTFGDDNMRMVGKLSKKPLDIVSGTDFAYSLSHDKKQYELGALREGDYLFSQGFGNQTYAFGKTPAKSMVLGNYNGKILQVSTGGVDYIISMPTIISSDLNYTDIMDQIKHEKLAYKGYGNLPASYSGTIFKINGGFSYQPSITVLFAGDIYDLQINENEWVNLLKNLQKSYSGTILADDSNYSRLVDLDINLDSPSKEVREESYALVTNDLHISTPIELTSGDNWLTYDISNGLLDNDTRSITQDHLGNIWFATKKGVSKFDGSIWLSYTESDGLADKDTRGVIQDEKGNMWFATNDGVTKYDGTNWITYRTSDGLIDDDIVYILQASDSDIWFATKKGVSSFDGENWTNYDKKDGLINKIVKVITQDNLGNLWFGTIDGVSRFDGTTWMGFHESDGLVDKNVLSLYTDREGNLWFGTVNGVSKYDGSTWTTFSETDGLVNKFVQDIYQDSYGNMWFATEKGVSMYDGSIWMTYNTNIGLADEDVKVIYEDSENNMRFGTKNGVTIFYR